MDKLKLLMGRPIEVDRDKGIFVHQPNVSDVVDLGEDGFNNLVLPYVLTTESVFNGLDNEEEFIKKFHIFDLFFVKVDENGNSLLDNVFGGSNSLDVLLNSIRYFLKVEDIRVLEIRKKIVINGSYMIDNNEFDRLRRIVQGVVNRGDIQVEKAPKNMTKRQKDIWTKLQKGRKRKAEKEAIHLQDMINFISFGGASHIPFEHIDRMTYYQMMNAYKAVMGKDAYNISMGYKLSYKFDVKDEVKHWTESMKIGK